MALFAEGVDRAQGVWALQLKEGPQRDFVLAPGRAQEAAQVDGCVQRFTRAELEGRDSVGRVRGGKVFPPLGSYVGKKLRQADQPMIQRVRLAINTAIATGYLGIAVGEADRSEVRTDRTEAQIWDFWVPRIMGAGFLPGIGLPDEVLSPIREGGGHSFVDDLGQIGMARLGKKLRRAIGSFYAQAGMVLRIAQTDLADHEMVVSPSSEERAAWAHSWRFEDYAP